VAIEFSGKVAIVTGAGNGLGRSHALALAARGAKVVVNDLGGTREGNGGSLSAAESVLHEITLAGGEALANGANVTSELEVHAMVSETMARWGRVDILINNAGILRDKSFAKMSIHDFRSVIDVHLMGAAICTKAVWQIMRDQNYGRIVMTTSPSGLYGNFGQANYSAAKLGLVGLMNSLAIEGQKNNIHVNAISPSALTRMTEGLASQASLDLMTVESITAAVLLLAADSAPTRMILSAAAGGYSVSRIVESEGIYLPPSEQTPERLADSMTELLDATREVSFSQAFEQTQRFLAKAASHHGIKLD
jgi:NAD(P)-dependent dehydrogenase (short-subunit alcohol dehydrogenase family)